MGIVFLSILRFSPSAPPPSSPPGFVQTKKPKRVTLEAGQGADQINNVHDDEDIAKNGSPLQATGGALTRVSMWETEHTSVLWSVQWKAKGLMPIRPRVVFKAAGALMQGRALQLNPPDA